MWENQVEELQKELDFYQHNREGMANLVLSELVFGWKGNPAGGFSLRLTNQSKHTIARVELIAELTSEGRTVPWAKDKIVWDFPGGLMPGEMGEAWFMIAEEVDFVERLRKEAAVHYVGALGRWWALAPLGTDYRLRVKLLAAYDESCDIFEDSDRGYNPLWFVDEDFSEKDVSDRLEKLRAKIARAESLITELSGALNKENADGKPAAR